MASPPPYEPRTGQVGMPYSSAVRSITAEHSEERDVRDRIEATRKRLLPLALPGHGSATAVLQPALAVPVAVPARKKYYTE
jgi:hypothetical protein